jgi:hypothetical protein
MGRDERCKGGDDCRDEAHLCKVVKKGDFDLLRELVRDAQHLCGKCGRAANSPARLCRPEKI